MLENRNKEISISVNGEPRAVPAGLTVLALLEAIGVDAERVAVELDCSILRREKWPSTPVEEGARLEIVQFVGGG